ncbi:ankyrin repeat domain-containing protein [Marinospirillum sp.]|uniref:ankyrin repeat domain-containing protein n=1 Tax=Marinospirillum sp. TaxID=2183934 RepID=UPI003A89477D
MSFSDFLKMPFRQQQSSSSSQDSDSTSQVNEGESFELFLALRHADLKRVSKALQKGDNPNHLVRGEMVNETIRLDDELWLNQLYTPQRVSETDLEQKKAFFGLLREAGLKADLTTESGFTALDVALQKRDAAMARFLIEQQWMGPMTSRTLSLLLMTLRDAALIRALCAEQATPPRVETAMLIDFLQNRPTQTLDEQEIAVLDLMVEWGLDLAAEHEGQSLLAHALSDRHIPIARALLARRMALGLDPEALALAIRTINDEELVGDLVAMQPEVEFPHIHRRDFTQQYAAATPITLAIHHRRWSLALYLMQRFPQMRAWSAERHLALDVLETLQDQAWPLYEAILAREVDLERRVYVNEKRDYEWTLLCALAHRYACKRELQTLYLSAIERLLKAGASTSELYGFHPDTENGFNNVTPLFAFVLGDAKDHGNDFTYCRPLFDLLFDYGGSAGVQQGSMHETAVQTIVQRSYDFLPEKTAVEFLDYIWQREGIDLKQVNTVGNSLLLSAAMCGWSKVIAWLLDHGADLYYVGGFDYSNAMHKALSNYDDVQPTRRLATVRTLLDYGMDIELPDPDPESQNTPLMTACQFGIQLVIAELVARGAQVNAISATGMTPLVAAITSQYCYDVHHSIEGSKAQLVRWLVEKGADVNLITDRRAHPLIEACWAGRKVIFKELLQLGADLYLVDPGLRTQQTSIGFIQPETLGSQGMNTLGYLLQQEQQAGPYLDVITELFGHQLLAAAQADMAAGRLPQAPEGWQQGVVKTSGAPVVPVAVEAIQTEINLDLSLPFGLLFKRAVSIQGVQYHLSLDELEPLIGLFTVQCGDVDWSQPSGWALLIEAALPQRVPSIASLVVIDPAQKWTVFLPGELIQEAEQVQDLDQALRDLFATPRALLEALQAMKGQLDPTRLLVEPVVEPSAEAAAPQVRMPVAQMLKRSQCFGLLTIDFHLQNAPLDQISRSLGKLVGQEISGEQWAQLIKALAEQQLGAMAQELKLNAIGPHFHVVIDAQSPAGSDLAAGFDALLESLFTSEEACIRQLYAVSSALES